MSEILGGLLVASALSGIVPVINAELLVLVAAAAVPALGVPLVAVISTIGQMSTKFSLFAVARWAPSRLPKRARSALERASRPLEKRQGAVWSLLFTSATTGVPPFYGVSLAAGAIGVRTSSFLTSGTLGRLIRFGVLAWIGQSVGPDAIAAFAGIDSLSTEGVG